VSGACSRCGKAKEASRVKSRLCRACDSAEKAKRAGVVGERKRLTLDLPADVWDRLDIEAIEHGQRIGGYVAGLVIARDERRVSRNKPSN